MKIQMKKKGRDFGKMFLPIIRFNLYPVVHQ